MKRLGLAALAALMLLNTGCVYSHRTNYNRGPGYYKQRGYDPRHDGYRGNYRRPYDRDYRSQH